MAGYPGTTLGALFGDAEDQNQIFSIPEEVWVLSQVPILIVELVFFFGHLSLHYRPAHHLKAYHPQFPGHQCHPESQFHLRDWLPDLNPIHLLNEP